MGNNSNNNDGLGLDENKNTNSVATFDNIIQSGVGKLTNTTRSVVDNNDIVQTYRDDVQALNYITDVITDRKNVANSVLTAETYGGDAAVAVTAAASSYAYKNSDKKAIDNGIKQGIESIKYNAYMADSGKTTTDFFVALSNKKIFLGENTVSYSKEGMGALANAFTDMFNRFATSYEWVNDVINKILQAGENSGIQSNKYGVDLKKFWDDNTENYENFQKYAGTWVDLIKYTIEQNEEVIQEVLAEYNSKVGQ